MPTSRKGRKTCSPPIDCRTSSAHSLNSATWPAASVCPWCHRTSPTIGRHSRAKLTGRVGAASSAPDNPEHERQYRRQAALPPEHRTPRGRPAEQARGQNGRAEDEARDTPLHRRGDGLQAGKTDQERGPEGLGPATLRRRGRGGKLLTPVHALHPPHSLPHHDPPP